MAEVAAKYGVFFFLLSGGAINILMLKFHPLHHSTVYSREERESVSLSPIYALTDWTVAKEAETFRVLPLIINTAGIATH